MKIQKITNSHSQGFSKFLNTLSSFLSDIVRRVKAKSGTPFRPAVQKYHATQTFADSSHLASEMYELMLSCLSEDPATRPTFPETRKFVRRLSRGK